jgi:hypothetical protein
MENVVEKLYGAFYWWFSKRVKEKCHRCPSTILKLY